MIAPVAGWLADLTKWLGDQLAALLLALADLVKDLVVFLIEGLLTLVQTIIAAIPVPDFITQFSICGLLSQAGPTAGWIMGVFQLNDCFTLLVSALGFRMLRKLLTLFQW